MRRTCLILVICVVIWPGWAFAQSAVDQNVTNALADIQRFEGQFSGQTPVNPSSVKRTLKLLKLTRQRLDASGNKSAPSWIEADNRYNALVERLNAHLNPGSKPGSQSATTAQQGATSAQPTTSAPAKDSPPKQMISQYRVRIKKIIRDIQSVTDTMVKGGVKPFQDSAYVEKFERSAQRFKDSLTKYVDYGDDPDVVAAHKALNRLEEKIAMGRQHAAKELSELGDVQARLRAIETQMRSLKQPSTPQEPYEKGELKQWLIQLATVRQAAAQTYQPLPEIRKRAYLPDTRRTVGQGGAYDSKDVDRLQRALVGLVNSIDSELKSFSEHLKLVVRNVAEGLNVYKNFDPTDRNDQTNHFLSAGRADEIRAALARDQQTVAETAQYAQLIKDPSYEERKMLLTEVQATAKQYEENHRKALALVRMPKEATTDPKLKNIALETLSKYDEIGEIKRLVINTEKVHRSKETSESKYNDIDVSLSGTITLTGTKTTYRYEWDQFQVATAEPVKDRHYIYYNTLKYFTSGASTTPLNKWIISGRIQGPEIPTENIEKD